MIFQEPEHSLPEKRLKNHENALKLIQELTQSVRQYKYCSIPIWLYKAHRYDVIQFFFLKIKYVHELNKIKFLPVTFS